MSSLTEYLKPTRLCDFDEAPQIRATAQRLTVNLRDIRQVVQTIYRYVKEFPYGLEDWDVKASQTLQKGWGMCSGKTNLLVAMARSLEIPARYIVVRIESEAKLWNLIANQDAKLARQIGKPAAEQDHVLAEIFIDSWEPYDTSRDFAFEEGLKNLGIPLERKPVTGPAGNSPIVLASFDEWAQNRQRVRRFREDRQELFSRMNAEIEELRQFGRG